MCDAPLVEDPLHSVAVGVQVDLGEVLGQQRQRPVHVAARIHVEGGLATAGDAGGDGAGVPGEADRPRQLGQVQILGTLG